MIGDKLKIKDHHIRAAKAIIPMILSEIQTSNTIKVLSVAGESGAGKSEIAYVIYEELEKQGVKTIILQQDDYFCYPPKTNDSMRRKDIEHVGIREVQLVLMDENIKDIVAGRKKIEKPLVNYDEDNVMKEDIEIKDEKVVIVEGTYTTSLKNIDHRIFIDRNYQDTRDSRKERAREAQDDYLEKILLIEHDIILAHKVYADIIVKKDYSVEKVEVVKNVN